MASVIHFCLALFIMTGLVQVDAYLKRYISLISNVHKYHGTSGVFFVYSRNIQNLEESTLASSLYRDFSREYIFTLLIDFEELDKRVNWNRKKIGRPLIVILLKSENDIAKFNKNTESMNISYPIWLVIFTNEFDKGLCEYCKYPKGNTFRLRFDTEMLVVCCDNSTLKEWWAVYENHTEMSDLATWTVNNELTFLTTDRLYTRRNNIKGVGLRVGLVTSTVLIRENGNKIEGFLGDIFTELKHAMNFTITEIVRDREFGSWNSQTESWNGVVGKLTRGEADIGLAGFYITKSKSGVVDFTSPLSLARSKLYIRDSDQSGVEWSAYFQAFTITTWIAIILLIITAFISLTVIKVHRCSTSLLSLIFENYLYVWGIFCQQGLNEFPAKTPLRIAYFSIFVSAMVISAAYSASLVSFLTVSHFSLPFSTLEGFVKDGSYKLIVYPNNADYDLFANSKDPLLKKMMALMKPMRELPITTMDGWDQVCQQKVALYTNDVSRRTSSMRLKCKVVGIDSGRTVSLSIILPVGSQYRKVMNYHIQRFYDAGLIKRLKKIYFSKSAPTVQKFDVLNLWNVAPILSTLAGGIILALIVLFCEKMYYSLKNNLRNRTYRKNWRKMLKFKLDQRVRKQK